MRALFAVLVVALPVFAAPVPKVKAKSTEEKLIGKWRMVSSDSGNGVGRGYQFFVIFKEQGGLELRYEYEGGLTRSYTGNYKVVGDDKIDYSADVGGRALKQEVLTIDKLTDTEVAWTDPDRLKESLEKVKE